MTTRDLLPCQQAALFRVLAARFGSRHAEACVEVHRIGSVGRAVSVDLYFPSVDLDGGPVLRFDSRWELGPAGGTRRAAMVRA